MSANPLTESGGVYSYDFTTSASQAYNSGQKDLGSGYFGMFAGDINAEGIINETDLDHWKLEAGKTDYRVEDANLDSHIDNRDKNDLWFPNNVQNSQVPE